VIKKMLQRMNVSANRVLTITYGLTNHVTGETNEETNESNPLVFLYGVGSMIPDFEANLNGLIAGNTFDFTIAAAQAYGEPTE
jgi:FKBP-type peptidyl-prolyl cis-trans isomerase SlyD